MIARLVGRVAVALTRYAHRLGVHVYPTAPVRSFDDGVNALITELDKQQRRTPPPPRDR